MDECGIIAEVPVLSEFHKMRCHVDRSIDIDSNLVRFLWRRTHRR